jgi:hypothetical protein
MTIKFVLQCTKVSKTFKVKIKNGKLNFENRKKLNYNRTCKCFKAGKVT